VQEVVNFLVTTKGMEPGYAYSLASIAVDFHEGEAVDQTQIVTGKIPKSIFHGGPCKRRGQVARSHLINRSCGTLVPDYPHLRYS
jgi:hypothetical protein